MGMGASVSSRRASEGGSPQRSSSTRSTRSIEDIYDIDRVRGGVSGSSFAKVKSARDKATGKHVAIRTFSSRQGDLGEPLSEIDVRKRLDHPNIIKLLDTFHCHSNDSVFMVLELAEGGELFDRICDAGRFTERQAAHCMAQIFRAVRHCHQNDICIRSLRPEAFLCMTRGPIDEVILKLHDLSLSKALRPGDFLTTKCGTPYYVSPQVLSGKYDLACDMWSCGIIAYVLLCGYFPFHGETDAEVLSSIRKGIFSFDSGDWKEISQDAKDEIRMLLKMVPRSRHSVNEAIKSSWMTSHFPRVVLSVHKEVRDSGGLDVFLLSLGGNEAARFSYDAEPALEELRAAAAAQLAISHEQVEFI
eukprot:TRINITY_DN65452_c0_g1_i1.p1 TRINITY_DN65452_c0_g1~~TRINITY_DN65452_c0_g1_i1.p1  ORF type:complete len:360 (+),score=45.95 TRINITY_DN65452_c0_g1_i1:27-1106(+)